jgi:hypothetical protein
MADILSQRKRKPARETDANPTYVNKRPVGNVVDRAAMDAMAARAPKPAASEAKPKDAQKPNLIRPKSGEVPNGIRLKKEEPKGPPARDPASDVRLASSVGNYAEIGGKAKPVADAPPKPTAKPLKDIKSKPSSPKPKAKPKVVVKKSVTGKGMVKKSPVGNWVGAAPSRKPQTLQEATRRNQSDEYMKNRMRPKKSLFGSLLKRKSK